MISLRLLLLLALFLPAHGSVRAQSADVTVRGRIVGPDNAALAGQHVVLHRVKNAEGATIAETTTARDGSFALSAPADTDTSAIFFVAARFEGELYIGPPFRPSADVGDQIIQVGVPGTSASALLGGPSSAAPSTVGRPLTSRNWLLLLIPLLGAAAVAIYALVPRGRMPEDRALLIRVAELDERLLNAPGPQRETLLGERTRLITRLRAG
jgi:hypothetical protein